MSSFYSISLTDGNLTVNIARPTLELRLKDGRPHRVTYGSNSYSDVWTVDEDLLEQHPGCQCLIRFANGLEAIATNGVLEKAKTKSNFRTGYPTKVVQCADLLLLEAEVVAA